MNRDGIKLATATFTVLVIGTVLPMLLFGPFGLESDHSDRLQGGLTYAGVMITAEVTLIGLAAKWQSDKRLMYERTSSSRS